MSSTSADPPARLHVSIPWLGARKMAHKLAADVADLQTQTAVLRDQLERFTVLGQKLVVELTDARAERDIAREQIELIGALPVLQLEVRRRELEKAVAAQASQIERENPRLPPLWRR